MKNSGNTSVLDEVHKYPDWSERLKTYMMIIPICKLFFTGSSILDIDKAEYDLSGRAVLYQLNNLSLREYIELKKVSMFFPHLN